MGIPRSPGYFGNLVHLQKDRLISSYCVIPAQFNPDFVEELNLAHLPSKWAAYPASLITQQMGDEWARSNRSPVLESAQRDCSPRMELSD